MAAEDYQICCGCFSAYIAKKKNKPSNIMSIDRREIDEEEILMLIDWYIDNQSDEYPNGLQFDSAINEGCKVQINLVKS